MIRKATEEDIPLIISDVGKRLHERSGDTEAEVHKPTAFAVMRTFVHARDKFFVVSEHEEVLRGFLMAGIESFWWADPARGRRYVTDWAFYSEVRGDGILMLRALQEWSWAQPRVIGIKCATQVPKGRGVVDKLFGRAGFIRAGGMYTVYRPE